MSVSVGKKALSLLQHLVPARLLARVVYAISRSEQPAFKNLLIRGFCRLYAVNTSEAARSVPEDYKSFNEFFTRELQPDARPVTETQGSICCPADGTIAQTGFARDGSLLQAKGINYRLQDLLADTELATSLRNSAFATIYLAPHNYHRVHMPIAGTLEQTIHIPGRLFSVNAATTATFRQLYVRNERLVCQFRSRYGQFAIVLVGAMNVSSFTTAWAGEMFSGSGEIAQRWFPADNKPPALAKGQYLGHFNMGSTVIFIAPPAHLRWSAELGPDMAVKMGVALGQLNSS